jgi:hypothetical protein
LALSRCAGLRGRAASLAATLCLGVSGLYLADRDNESEHTCRDSSSIKHG